MVVDEAVEAVGRRAEKLAEEGNMMIRGTLIDDSTAHALALMAIAQAGAASRRTSIVRMAAAYHAKLAVQRIEKAYLSWSFRKGVLWNPRTDRGVEHMLQEWLRWQAEDGDE